MLHFFVTSFEFLYFCLKLIDQVFEIVIVFFFLPEFVNEIKLLLFGILVAVQKWVFELFGHDLHFLAGSLRFLYLLLQLVEELLVACAYFLYLGLQHLLLAAAVLPLPLVFHQLLLVVEDLFSQTVVLLLQPHLLTWYYRLDLRNSRGLFVLLFQLLQLGTKNGILLLQASQEMGVWFLMLDEPRAAALLVRSSRAVGDDSVDITLYILEVVDEEMWVGCWFGHSLLLFLYHRVNSIVFGCIGDCCLSCLWRHDFYVYFYWGLDEDALLDFYNSLNHPLYLHWHLNSNGFFHDDLFDDLNWHLNLCNLHHFHYLLHLHHLLHKLLNFHYFIHQNDFFNFNYNLYWYFHNHNTLYFHNLDDLIGHLLLNLSDYLHFLYHFNRHLL